VNPWLQLAVAAAPGAVAAFFAYRASTRTSRVQAQSATAVAELNAATERNRLDLERQRMAEDAARKAQEMYAQLIGDLRGELERTYKQVERVQTQTDRIGDQLAKEQDVSSTLRLQVRVQSQEIDQLRAQVETLEGLVQRLRGHPGVDPTAAAGSA
jgi:chromosome segregation ATPase